MKRIITIISAALLSAASFNASATIAYPYPIKVTQPDGSVITIQMHGDENHHWITSEGKVVASDSDGFYREVSGPAMSTASAASSRRFELAQPAAAQQTSQKIAMGENHFLVVLVEFKDLVFSVSDPRQAFSDMLNKEDYSANSGTGSVRDYYIQNSASQFKPTFDVFGPVKVSGKYSYYGADSSGDHDARVALAFWEACSGLDAEVDFSKYDIDNDGSVDNIFFYYAGRNQAEGAGDNYIWPHASNLTYAKSAGIISGSIVFDGKSLGRYACTSELKGQSGSRMCGIGTFCHEFGHVLGLPDLYDTDYESNGQAEYGMGEFSLMASGNYNNEGRTPPALGAIERQIIGWMDEIPEWTTSGSKEVPDIMGNVAYRTGTGTDGEYFVYETRGGSTWDSWISKSGSASGLLIYHVDKSDTKVSGKTAASLWSLSSNKINAYGSHPCCQPMPSSGRFSNAPSGITYPGSRNVTSFDENSPSPMVDWAGNQTGRYISDISYAGQGGSTTLTFGIASGKTVSGTVKDTAGNPVIGASVVLTPRSSAKSFSTMSVSGLDRPMRAMSINMAPSSNGYSLVTASDGSFFFDLSNDSANEFTLSVTCHGYQDYASSFRLTVGNIERNIVLRGAGSDNDSHEFQKFDNQVTSAITFGQPVVAAVRYTVEELVDAAGSQIVAVSYELNDSDINEARIIVDFGSDTVLDLPIENPVMNEYTDVDVSSYGLIIPQDKDVYVGVYVDIDPDSDNYPFVVNDDITGRNGFYARLLGSMAWSDLSDQGTLAMGFTCKQVHTQPYLYGYNGIANPKEGRYTAGENFKLELVESSMVPDSVDWFFDNEAVDGAAVTLPEGEHVVKAVLHFNSGRTETIEQIILAE